MAVSAGLLAQCLVTKTVTLPFCEDAFATHGRCRRNGRSLRSTASLTVRCSSWRCGDCAARRAAAKRDRPCGVRRLPRTEPVEQGVRVTVPVNVRVLGLDAEGMMQGLSGAARAETELPAECGAVCRASAALRPEGSASPSGDGAELRAALTMDAGFFAQQTPAHFPLERLIRRRSRRRGRPSLVIRAGLDGGPVWDVASSMARPSPRSARRTGWSGEIEAGGMLLIPM